MVKIKLFMLFICLCDIFKLLLDKPSATPLINTIAEYFLLKNYSFPKAVPETRFKTALLMLRHKIQ